MEYLAKWMRHKSWKQSTLSAFGNFKIYESEVSDETMFPYSLARDIAARTHTVFKY